LLAVDIIWRMICRGRAEIFQLKGKDRQFDRGRRNRSSAVAAANPATTIAEPSMKAIPRMDAPIERSDRRHIVPSAASAKRRFSLD